MLCLLTVQPPEMPEMTQIRQDLKSSCIHMSPIRLMHLPPELLRIRRRHCLAWLLQMR
jgi:hypothetical protein